MRLWHKHCYPERTKTTNNPRRSHLMATSFSPTPTLRSIFQNPPKPFLLNRYSFTSASSYVTLNLPRRFTLSGTLTGRPLLSKGFFTLHKRYYQYLHFSDSFPFLFTTSFIGSNCNFILFFEIHTERELWEPLLLKKLKLKKHLLRMML